MGPIIGGAIATGFSWRGVFVFLAAMAFVLFILTIVFVPETLHYIVLKEDEKKAAKKKGRTESQSAIIQGNVETVEQEPIEVVVGKPKMQPPWQPLFYLRDPMILYCAWF